jgi:glycine hydroxymethyltransferase
MADIAHYAGLVAAGVYPSPVPCADFVTFTTHKTMRGPRGGVILCKSKFAKDIDRTIFPGTQGGPLMHVIAAKAVAFKEASSMEFKNYQRQVLANARALAGSLERGGFKIISGGTDCHMFMVDVTAVGLTGRDAQNALESAGITVNKNSIPYDKENPAVGSGIRIGTPALTTRGMKEREMEIIGNTIASLLKKHNSAAEKSKAIKTVRALTAKFPLYPRLKIG